MKNKLSIIPLFLFVILTACENVKKGLGIEKDKPNEFLIEKRDSLVLPPNYKIIPPESKSAAKEINENSLKSVLDQSLNNKNEKLNTSKKSSTNLEEEILKQIK